MTPDFWIERWQKGEIGFHQAAGNDLLQKHWSSLGAAPGSTVFVPLCGKSLDMVWLAGQGHRVIGVELSPLAVDDFFRELGVEADTRTAGALVVRTAGPITIWCGDIFDLPAEVVREVGAVYDRAALVAFPPSLQARYAQRLADILPAGVPTLLVSLAYPQEEMSGPPFSTPLARVAELFGKTHDISLYESRDGLAQSPNLRERGLSALEEAAYVLRPKAA
ncbi:thiopurine S-methyltransferase [Hyphomicrobium sp.]|uniref:thiopurine S-methyltransferase n=1 Tax=Hyphomicrobium sp. TaxID=82 RepID=UPI0025C73698|nr:thiopurine S-methyltransferase [Hyphomicrobium sp.]MCC7254095.1 thiopurine S-methyltransferase [Hyphomicrobium sp.]